jgi:hypothetical protein
MKTILIGSLVGAIILFGWQAFSWTASGIHDDAFRYIPNQDEVLQTLSSQIPGGGQYMVPMAKPGLSDEEKQKYNESMMGKTYAVITYVPAYNADMALPMLRGFLISFVCVLLVCLVLRRFDPAYVNFLSVFTSVLTFGVVSFLFIWYNQHNWFRTPWHFLWGEMIDNLVSWGLCGVWLGWWYSRKNKRVIVSNDVRR